MKTDTVPMGNAIGFGSNMDPETENYLAGFAENGSRSNGQQADHFSSFSFNSSSYIDGNEWPELSEKAYHGLVGDIVRAIEPHTESDSAALMAQLLVGFGNCIGRRPYFQVEADRHFTNLYLVIVGASAKSRKGTAWGHIRRLFSHIDPEWVKERIQDGLSSGEGLINAVADDAENQDKRLLALQSEFSSTLRVMSRDGNTLSAKLRQAWDTGNLRTLTLSHPLKASDAHCSIIGHITRDELRRELTGTDCANGFANRFLFLCAKRSKFLPEGGNLQTSDLQDLIERLDAAVRFAGNVNEMGRDEQAREAWRIIYQDLSAGGTGLFGAVTSRAEAQVTRISCIYALMNKSAVIRKVDLEAALAFWEYCEDSARFIFGDSLGDATADAILRALKLNTAGMTKTEISELFKRNKSASDIDRALSMLRENGLAERRRERTEGRTAEVWVYMGGTN